METPNRLPNYNAPTAYPTAQAILVFKTGSRWYARNSVDGSIITSNTDFSTVMNAASSWISAGNAVIFIKDPGSDIIPTATITFSNKEVFVTSDFATINNSGLNDVCFLFQDTVQTGYKICGISNFRIKGDQTHSSEVFARFSEVRAKVDNLLVTDPSTAYTLVHLYGGCYLSIVSNVQGRAVAPIVIEGHGGGDLYTANGACIDHCDVGYLSGANAIMITKGDHITVRDCWIEAVQNGVNASNAAYLTVKDCYIKCTVSGIKSDSFFTIVEGNSIILAAASAIGIWIVGGYYGPTITGNFIYGGALNSLIGISLPGSSQLGSITGNIIEIEGASTGSYGILCASTVSWYTITGNVLYNTNSLTGTGISISTLNYGTVVGNTIYNWTTPVTISTRNSSTVEANQGYKSRNTGASTGTGAQQTIAHGLGMTPTFILFGNIGNGANPYRSAASDATNIYITAVNALSYYWEAGF